MLEPRAGLFLWAELPDGIDAAAVARLALNATHGAAGYLRFNVANSADPRIFAVLERAMRSAAR